VRDKAKELEEISRQIFEVMIDGDANEEQLLQETETADDYRVEYQHAKIAVT